MIAFIFYTNAMGGGKKLSFSVELGIFFILVYVKRIWQGYNFIYSREK